MDKVKAVRLFKENKMAAYAAVAFALLILACGAVNPVCGCGPELINFAKLALGGGVGLYLFFVGFNRLREKWLVDNTPTSKIRSVAMGLAEVAGIAVEKTLLISPLSQASCVYYEFRIQKETRDSKGNRSWQTVNSGCSTNYFYVKDTTGQILIDPLGAETILTQDYNEVKGEYKYTEWYIAPGDYVYTLGTAREFKNCVDDRNVKLLERLRALKEDKEAMKAVDTNQDGVISPDEWDAARKKVEQQLLEEELKNPPSEEDTLVIAKGEAETTFILSDKDEKEVSSNLGLKSFAMVFVGMIVVIGVTWAVINRLGLISGDIGGTQQTLHTGPRQR